ncbi:DUF3000 domain-containing protein [Fodinicola feengrottensis]|uniref:DUF3000 domain-containing protein n=1 Tax=Fodinicola feengrottensis TaxID=435914 RepID=UPI0013D0BEFE|nr:DUF3000 domain-containing protein [Fodinicola feengrottensis]
MPESAASASKVPDVFAQAVNALCEVKPRAEIALEEIPPPQRLAPYSFAMSASVTRDDSEVASGRLILLYDPAGQEAWDGLLRIVTFVSAELDSEMAADPLLAEVGWSWLVESLDDNGAQYTAAGGTVTHHQPSRFGDLAGPADTADVELRASWTALDTALGPHLEAWCTLLASTAGLPPPGVTPLMDGRTR